MKYDDCSNDKRLLFRTHEHIQQSLDERREIT